jgi:hypothetical protein
MTELVQYASQIIFSNEGNYSTVNNNDNGAVSVGKCQWHGNRAKELLKNILIDTMKSELYAEILGNKPWSTRVVNENEASIIKMILTLSEGKEQQDILAEKDITNYINHIQKIGILVPNICVFLADIENQGGAAAVDRIVKNTIAKFGPKISLDNVMYITIRDRVFKKYQDRRYIVYKKLTGHQYTDVAIVTPYTYYIVKSGDTLSNIAYKYDTTIDKIVADNNIKDKNVITVGQQLKICR